MPKDETKTIIGATLFILAFAVASSLMIKPGVPEKSESFMGSWACTTDIQICPDGTEVNRVPPYCKVAACPN